MSSGPWNHRQFYYSQTSRKTLCPTFYKPVAAAFWTIRSKYLCFIGEVSAISRKEKEANQNWINEYVRNPGEACSPSPNYFFYNQIWNGVICHFLVWNIIIRSFSLSYTTVTLMYFSHRTITFGSTLSQEPPHYIWQSVLDKMKGI